MKVKKKMQGMKKKFKSKISAVKLSNKHLNKLGKQGKLKQEAHKRKLKQKRLEKSRNKTNEGRNAAASDIKDTCEELGEEDVSFYSNKCPSSGFISTVKSRVLYNEDVKKSKKRKKSEENSEDEEYYERLPRKVFSADGKKKMILPIKTIHGIVPQMVDNESEQEVEDEEITEPDVREKMEKEILEKEQSLPVLNGVDLYLHRQKKLAERKQKIASLSSSIISSPEDNIKKLHELVSMLKEKDQDVYITVKKYVMVSLLEVFKDVIPGYYIRLPTEKEEQQKMKKETKAVLDHELGLVRCYKDYLDFLDKTAKGTRGEESIKIKQKMKKKISVPLKSQQVLTELSVKCLCELLSTHPHFNYRNNIIMVIVPYMNNRNSEISDMACNCVKKCFKEDKAGNITLELTKCIGRMIKAREYRVQPKVLETFLSLKIKEVSYTDPLSKDENTKDKKNHKLNDRLSRKEKKRKKKMIFLEKDLEETKATEDKKLRLKLHTETIQAVFLTYFRILKKATSSVLFPFVLEGLAKFAHLISVDFFDDLFTVFNKLISEQELTYRESLHCVQTAFTILSGQGSVLNIDPVIFYKHLYKNLFHVHGGITSQDVGVVLQCLDVMISKRKRQVSQQRILAFIKRLATLCVQQTSSGMLGLLAAIRSFMLIYNYTDILLDNDAQGSGIYLPDVDDPEHCHAHNAALWELTLLQHHYDPAVRRLSIHLSHGSLSAGEVQLPAELRKKPLEMFETAEKSKFFTCNVAQKVVSKKNKFQRKHLIQEDMEEVLVSALQSTGDIICTT
ncbi:nucleolar complex protein 3 homolog [Mercenaria mercenaria]|uniref:nucleolar complex protein 3 homolog n=1 Tax=Mercenaria mercenaria TaxID=6596 RepID=UPI00234E9D07|nr:nucleolar complex protein 3 homolog [Mercenaria mercenaria]